MADRPPSPKRQLVELNRTSLFLILLLVIAGWQLVSKVLAWDIYGEPRPNQYYTQTRQEMPIVSPALNPNNVKKYSK